MMTRLDLYVGQVIRVLEELDIANHTLVIFTSDNGPHQEGGANPNYFGSYGNFRGVKRDLYEGGIRLPMIAWAPGMVPAGIKNNRLVAMWDMLPTFAEIAGARIPDSVRLDGLSLVPTLQGQDAEQKAHPYLYWEFHEQGGKIAVRVGKWKGIIQNFTRDANAQYELYDLSKDIHEDHNVAAEHPEIVEHIRQIVREARTDSPIFKFNNKSTYI